jgi:dipeptidyl-peptidase 4
MSHGPSHESTAFKDTARDMPRLAGVLRHVLWLGLSCFAATVSPNAAGSLPPRIETRLRAIYGTREYDEASVGVIRWLEGGRAYALLERVPGRQGRVLVRYDSACGRREVLASLDLLTPTGASAPLRVDDFAVSPDASAFLLVVNDRTQLGGMHVADLWVLQPASGALRQVAADAQQVSAAHALSPDGSRVLYARRHDLYVQALRSGATTRLTRDGIVGSIGNGVNDWGGGLARWSPDSSQIAYVQNDSRAVGLVPFIDQATDLHPTPVLARLPKVGTPIARQRLGIVSARGGRTRWAALPEIDGGAYLEGLRWSPDSRQVLVEQMARSKARRSILVVNARSRRAQAVHREEDPAWVDFDRDGGNLYLGNGAFAWLEGGRAFTWAAETDGWRRVYVVGRDGRRPLALTPESVDVMSVPRVDTQHGGLYYTASPANATEQYLFRVSMDGRTRPERLTPPDQAGTHDYDVSPDGRWAMHTYSTADSPPVIELIELPSHRRLRVIEDNGPMRERLAAWGSPPVEFLTLNVGADIDLDAWLLKPRDFDPTKKYPVVVFVYGATAPTVVDAWSFGLGRGLFHRAMADAGYLVTSIDNRGTFAPKGGAWRRAGFGSPGVLALEEQAAGLEALARTRPYVDRSRVAIWGTSAGGTNVLNAVFRRPDLYHVGVALAAHSKLELANAWYQERFMRTPEENPEGYRRADPINFAEGLQGSLLLIHGSADDTVPLQSIERLVNRLIELGKPFDYVVYPNRGHGFTEGPGNTTLHLHSRIAQYLIDHVPPGAR